MVFLVDSWIPSAVCHPAGCRRRVAPCFYFFRLWESNAVLLACAWKGAKELGVAKRCRPLKFQFTSNCNHLFNWGCTTMNDHWVLKRLPYVMRRSLQQPMTNKSHKTLTKNSVTVCDCDSTANIHQCQIMWQFQPLNSGPSIAVDTKPFGKFLKSFHV